MADATDTAKARAEELGVDLEKVEGTGQDGRVTAPDVEAFAKSQEEPQEGAPAPPAPLVRAVLNPATQLGGYGFEDGFSVYEGEPKSLSEEEFEKYSKVKHDGKQVLVKA